MTVKMVVPTFGRREVMAGTAGEYERSCEAFMAWAIGCAKGKCVTF
jgi:hypothetical protein